MQHRAFITALLLSVTVTLVGASLFPAFPTPAFFWSGNRFFGDQKESLETLQSDSITDFVLSVVRQETGSDLDKFVSNNQPLEAIVLFIDPKPALSNEFYSFLKPILSQSNSLVLPFVYKSESLSTTSQDILYGVPASQKILVSNSLSIGNMRREHLVDFISQNDVIFSNGVTDVITVYLEKQENRAGFVESVNNAIKARTTDYMALLIADTDYTREDDGRDTHERQMRDIEKRDASDYINSTYWPQGVWEGLLTTLLLLSILAVGLWCTGELQTPTKWEKPKPLHLHGQ